MFALVMLMENGNKGLICLFDFFSLIVVNNIIISRNWLELYGTFFFFQGFRCCHLVAEYILSDLKEQIVHC